MRVPRQADIWRDCNSVSPQTRRDRARRHRTRTAAWPDPSSLLVRTKRKEIMRHLMVSGVNDLIVHREHEDAVEVLLHQFLEVGHGLAVDVPRLALRRGII